MQETALRPKKMKLFKKLKGGGGTKLRMDLEVDTLEGLPQPIRECRVVWARSSKVQMTNLASVRGGGWPGGGRRAARAMRAAAQQLALAALSARPGRARRCGTVQAGPDPRGQCEQGQARGV